MSTNNLNDQPTNHETFTKMFSELIANARANGQAPPTAEAAIAGLDLIKNLYTQFPATEQSAKTALDLAKTLFYEFPHFREAYEAAAK
jgi:hypothetical protein